MSSPLRSFIFFFLLLFLYGQVCKNFERYISVSLSVRKGVVRSCSMIVGVSIGGTNRFFET